MPPILGSLSPRAIHLRHLLARSSSPAPAPSSSIVPNAATLATAMTPSRRNICSNTKCEERYHWLTWRVLPVLGLVFWYSQEKLNTRIEKLKESVAEHNKQNMRIKKLKESVAELNKDKEKKMSCSCSATPTKGATTSTTTDAAAPMAYGHDGLYYN